ncbi:hypothetical protein VNI00_010704 [Paramarasmius palmivorus]|uniref:DUF4112 domain-containing protein n=1 Tax=Paramarasmius palmivorus TaxID=297713 RepID=A0AAW0CFW1_9AGAR
MSALLGKAGKELFERHLEQYAPADPYYEEYTDKKGKKRRKKRDIPPGLSSRDAKILKSVQKRAHYLDKGFSICGFRFGWTFIVGIVPGAGDILGATLSYTLVVRKAKKAEIPGWLLSRMLANNAVSAGVGLVPFVGDVFVAVYKTNSRNAALLEEFLRIRGEEFLKLSAAGKDVENAVKPSKSIFGKKNGKQKEVAGGVTKNDAEQVKPGSGMTKGSTVPGGTTPVVEDQTPLASGSGSEAGTGVKPSGSGKSATRKGFGSFFAGRPKTPGEKGRFVENVDATKNAA